MSLFTMPSVVSFPSGQVVVEEGQIRRVERYEGRENYPVNLYLVFSFERMNDVGLYPSIRFRNSDGNIVRLWRYPPNDEGITQRDADYNFLLG